MTTEGSPQAKGSQFKGGRDTVAFGPGGETSVEGASSSLSVLFSRVKGTRISEDKY